MQSKTLFATKVKRHILVNRRCTFINVLLGILIFCRLQSRELSQGIFIRSIPAKLVLLKSLDICHSLISQALKECKRRSICSSDFCNEALQFEHVVTVTHHESQSLPGKTFSTSRLLCNHNLDFSRRHGIFVIFIGILQEEVGVSNHPVKAARIKRSRVHVTGIEHNKCTLSVIVSPARLHLELFFEQERLRSRGLKQLRTLHPLMILFHVRSPVRHKHHALAHKPSFPICTHF
mmetsp:Transcript_13708/g.26538  ORF Transcript_13708/g.26538 Transcript_13708/m.26538 type:complete len:234 (+) Transcript_13708:826-1527(+)